MTIYALDDIDDGIAATKELLLPVNRWFWAKLAVVVFFIGGGGGTNPLQFTNYSPNTGPSGPNGPGIPGSFPMPGAAELAIILVIIGIIALIVLGLMLIGSVMEFIFVRSLSDETLAIRQFWREYWSDGVRLFGFRLVIGILTFGSIGALAVIALAPTLLGLSTLGFALIPLAILIAIPVILLSSIIHSFTTSFVVPIMMLENRGVIDGWRRFWTTLREQWKQYLAFLLLGFVLNIAGGIVAGLGTLLVAIVLAIPLGILALIGVVLLDIVGIIGGILIGIAALAFVILVFTAALVIAVPVQVFLRYYALLVLGDTNTEFDIIQDVRTQIRAD